MALFNEVTGAFVELDAHILFKVAASFTHQTAGNTARARRNRNVVSDINIMRNQFIDLVIRIFFDGRFNRDNPHDAMANRDVAR